MASPQARPPSSASSRPEGPGPAARRGARAVSPWRGLARAWLPGLLLLAALTGLVSACGPLPGLAGMGGGALLSLGATGATAATPAAPTEGAAPAEPSATPTLMPTDTPWPTLTPPASATPEPTATPPATATPEPTATPVPTATPAPTATPSPAPTELPPAAEAVPSASVPANSPPTRIQASSAGLDVPVVEMGYTTVNVGGIQGTGWLVPNNAAGFHKGSAYPGHPGNTVISGHSNAGAQVFRHLVDVAVGDAVIVYVGQDAYRYQVSQRVLVREAGVSNEQRVENGKWIAPTGDERLTLVTCWPSSGAAERLILVALPLR